MTDQTPTPNTSLPQNPSTDKQLESLVFVNRTILRLSRSLELETVLGTLLEVLDELQVASKIMIFVREEENTGLAGLRYGAASPALLALPESSHLRHGFISLYGWKEDSPLLPALLRGETVVAALDSLPDDSPIRWLCALAQFKTFTALPLFDNDQLVGLVMFEGETSPETQETLNAMSSGAAIAVRNAVQHSRIVSELSTHAHELNILQQIDRELNEVIELNHVFNMTLDWVLRFTQAQAASLSLYDEDMDELTITAQYGYSITPEQIQLIRQEYPTSISQRVARTAQGEIIPDVAMDPDYVPFSPMSRSQMSVPVIREDKVLAVITVESNRANAFTDSHLGFTEALASRAAVAIDNARLFTETKREREKLSHILSNIADAVVVADEEGRIMLVNQAALAAMQLNANTRYVGQAFTDVFTDTVVLDIFQRASDQGHRAVQEVTLPNGRTYYISSTPYKGIGQVVVMQDITRFKELDQLKSELIATVSHDLKQPLSIMRGYLDLMTMVGNFNEQTSNYASRMARAITNMRDLIDDLLDIAKIESGVKLNFEKVNLSEVLEECVENLRPASTAKQMLLSVDLPKDLPLINADRARLWQIFNNLINNAIKYTAPEGHIKVRLEQGGANLRVIIKDNGLGISPEDQAHIFDRFYRVRRAETESIEGTGLGLAIVKSLVEAHKGQISVESHIGIGSTFFVTLPIQRDDEAIKVFG